MLSSTQGGKDRVREWVAKFARPVMVWLQLKRAGAPVAVPATPPKSVMRPP